MSAATITLGSVASSRVFRVGARLSRVTGVLSRKSLLSGVTVSVTGVLAFIGSAAPWGRSTLTEFRCCIESDASIKEASRKNITSIMGMISIRPRLGWRLLRSFMT